MDEEPVTIVVNYGALSNIAYAGIWQFECDAETWNDMNELERDGYVQELVGQRIADDISWDWAAGAKV